MGRRIALVGNPNVGKSTIFNLLTGLNQKVGNYPGVTVDKKYGNLQLAEETIEIVDLPGTYSIHPKTEDEQVVYDYLTDENPPDLVVVIVDAINLQRNLLLFSQVYDLKLPVILVLNRIDLAEKDQFSIATDKLSSLLGGIPVVSLNAKGGSVDLLKSAIHEYQTPETWQPFHASESEMDYADETTARYQKMEKLLGRSGVL